MQSVALPYLPISINLYNIVRKKKKRRNKLNGIEVTEEKKENY